MYIYKYAYVYVCMFVYVYNHRRQPDPCYSQSWKRLWETRGGAGQVLLSGGEARSRTTSWKSWSWNWVSSQTKICRNEARPFLANSRET